MLLPLHFAPEQDVRQLIMSSKEINFDDMRELRGRIDSLCNAVFLISGGALTLSITVMLDAKSGGSITETISNDVASAWASLLYAIFAFVGVKVFLILLALFRELSDADMYNKSVYPANILGFCFLSAGHYYFFTGMCLMVKAASCLIIA